MARAPRSCRSFDGRGRFATVCWQSNRLEPGSRTGIGHIGKHWETTTKEIWLMVKRNKKEILLTVGWDISESVRRHPGDFCRSRDPQYSFLWQDRAFTPTLRVSNWSRYRNSCCYQHYRNEFRFGQKQCVYFRSSFCRRRRLRFRDHRRNLAQLHYLRRAFFHPDSYLPYAPGVGTNPGT